MNSIAVNNHKKQLARKIVQKSRVRLPHELRHRSSFPIPAQSPCENSGANSSFFVQSLLHNYCNFKKSDVPVRFMYCDGDSWIDFSGNVIDLIRSCFVERNPMIDIKIGGVVYLFDFYRMLVFDFGAGDHKSVAWIDVKNQCFFPKVSVGGEEVGEFVDDNMNSGLKLGKIEIDVTVGDGNRDLKKRKRECEVVKTAVSCSNVKRNEVKKPKLEDCCEVVSPRWKKAKLIAEGTQVYLVVKNLFMKWAGIEGTGAIITGIHKFTRTESMDRARYDAFQKQLNITKAARGDANVTFAWFRSSNDGVESILNYGFSNPSKASVGDRHGVGIYLSPFKSTQVSAMVPDASETHVILCRVILGKCEKVELGSQQLYPSSVEFDTGVDDVNNPKWYIVWGANMNSHILPECVVSYKHTHNVPGRLSGTSNMKAAPIKSNPMTAKFFSKLIDALPSAKVPELQTLYATYTEGKVPKGAFMTKLRSVVGDQMLRTAMQEVCG